MRKAAGIIALVALIGAGIAGAVFHARTHRRPSPPVAEEEVPVYGGVTVQGPVLRIRDEATNELRWEIRAKRIRVGQSTTDATRVDGLQQANYYEKGKQKLSVTAGWLRYNPVTRNFEVRGKVTVSGYLGMLVTTDVVRWLSLKQQIVCPGEVEAAVKRFRFKTKRVELFPKQNRLLCPNEVHLTGGTAFLRGSRMEANLATETVHIHGPVKMRARVGEGKRPFAL